MAMGIVSDSDFEKEKEKLTPSHSDTVPSPKPTATIVDSPHKGRGEGNVEVPNNLRKMIGEESAINGREAGLEMARQFGISPSSVSAYQHGATSTASYDEQPNIQHINNQKDKISKKARAKLFKALKHLTDDKLTDAKAKDLAGIAKDMSAVIRSMEPDTPKGPSGNSGPTFIFYSPQFRKEEHFETVLAKE